MISLIHRNLVVSARRLEIGDFITEYYRFVIIQGFAGTRTDNIKVPGYIEIAVNKYILHQKLKKK